MSIANCATQTDSLCSICNDGFQLSDDSKTCTPCAPDMAVNSYCACGGKLLKNCVSCTEGICATCQKGYHQVNGICAVGAICPANCISCTTDKCTKCNPNFGINAEGGCDKCGTRCVLCPMGVCATCEAGNSLVSGNCVPCERNCKTCSGKCTECFDGYYLQNGCKSCDLLSNVNQNSLECSCKAAKNCANCSITGCANCLVGFSSSKLGICQECDNNNQIGPDGQCSTKAACDVENCFDCQYSKATCRMCKNGFVMNPNGICVNSCTGNGLQNQYCNIEKQIWESCPQNKKQIIGMKLACNCGTSQNCGNCDGNSCKDCFPGYIKNESGLCMVCDSKYTYFQSNLKCNKDKENNLTGAGYFAIVFTVTAALCGIGYVIYRYIKWQKIEKAWISGKVK